MSDPKRAPYDFNRVLKITPQDNGKNLGQEKETVATYLWVAPNPRFNARDASPYGPRRYSTPITIRVYMARGASASVVYASIWANSRDGLIYTAGHGNASGYGYDKTSAAIDSAFYSAGIEMEKPFGGCGESVSDIAIQSLARKLGWNTGQIIKT